MAFKCAPVASSQEGEKKEEDEEKKRRLCELYFSHSKRDSLGLYWLAGSCRSRKASAGSVQIQTLFSPHEDLQISRKKTKKHFKSSGRRDPLLPPPTRHPRTRRPNKAPLLPPWKTCHSGWAQRVTFKTGQRDTELVPHDKLSGMLILCSARKGCTMVRPCKSGGVEWGMERLRAKHSSKLWLAVGMKQSKSPTERSERNVERSDVQRSHWTNTRPVDVSLLSHCLSQVGGENFGEAFRKMLRQHLVSRRRFRLKKKSTTTKQSLLLYAWSTWCFFFFFFYLSYFYFLRFLW